MNDSRRDHGGVGDTAGGTVSDEPQLVEENVSLAVLPTTDFSN